MNSKKVIYQFKVTLLNVRPPVWHGRSVSMVLPWRSLISMNFPI